MSSSNLFAVSIDTPYNEIILVDRARYKQFPPEDVQKYKDAFKHADVPRDDLLDVFELAKFFEKLGDTKTRTEVKSCLVVVDGNKDGKITFSEVLDHFLGEDFIANHCKKSQDLIEGIKDPQVPSTKAKGGLQGKAAFFEQAVVNASRDKTSESREQLNKEVEERRRLEKIRKDEEDRIKAEEEAKRKAAEDSKARLASKLAAFQK